MNFSYSFLGKHYAVNGKRRVYFEGKPSKGVLFNRGGGTFQFQIYDGDTLVNEGLLKSGCSEKVMYAFNFISINTHYDYCIYKITVIYELPIKSLSKIPAVQVIDRTNSTKVSVLNLVRLKIVEEVREKAIQKICDEIEAKVRREWDTHKREILEEKIRDDLMKSGELSIEPKRKKESKEEIF